MSIIVNSRIIFCFCPKECCVLHWWAKQNKIYNDRCQHVYKFLIFYPNSSLMTQMTITIMTKATTIYSAIKPSSSKMSNIRKSVANIQHTRHIRSAIAAMLITYDKHPLIIVCHLSDLLFRGLFKLLYEKLDKLVRQC